MSNIDNGDEGDDDNDCEGLTMLPLTLASSFAVDSDKCASDVMVLTVALRRDIGPGMPRGTCE